MQQIRQKFKTIPPKPYLFRSQTDRHRNGMQQSFDIQPKAMQGGGLCRGMSQ